LGKIRSAGEKREFGGRSKAVRRESHDLQDGILQENEEGRDDLDRFADLVSLVALVRLVELGGRNYGERELGGRNYGEGELGGRNYGGTKLGGRN